MVKKRNKQQDLLNSLLVIIIIALCNVVSSFVHTRFDLTEEKRYTLSEKTQEMLKELDDVVYFRIYLEGDFPAGFDRLRSATKEMLDEFRAYSGNNIEYEFINPSESAGSRQEQNAVYKQLYEKGLEPTFLEVKDQSESSQQIIFPGAIATYKGHEMAVQLFRNQVGQSPDVVLNNSVEGLEYELANTIRKLEAGLRPRVAFIQGQHELDTLQTADFRQALKEYYDVEDFNLDGKLANVTDIRKYKAVIVAKPDSAFTEPQKFILDQFVMNGGKILWMVDNVYASMDSLRSSSMTYGLQVKLNLQDLLFKYGARINGDLVQDLKCGAVPLYVNNQWKPFPWLFFPLVTEGSSHPIVKNMNAVRCEFVSSVDTIKTDPSIKKTILLSTSKYANALVAPVRIDLRMASRPPTQKQFKRSDVPVAVLLEGEFESNWNNQLRPKMIDSIRYYQQNSRMQQLVSELAPEDTARMWKMILHTGPAFLLDSIRAFRYSDKSKNAYEDFERDIRDTSKLFRFSGRSKPTRMIVIGDGDICKNAMNHGQPLPLGFDQYTQQTYGNKNFLLNAMNYLCDESGMLSLRTREFVLRVLDKEKVEQEKTTWQIVNTALPIAMILLFGILRFYIRRRKYSS
jgi:ABC-2 type transport system permease protein